MNDNNLKTLSLWFDNYTKKFNSNDEYVLSAIKLKIRHTLLVCANIKAIVESLNLPTSAENIALSCALLHDVGRFEQVVNFSSFNDAKSCDHAELSVEVLKNQNVLFELDSSQKEIIYTAIEWHNKKALPDNLDENQLMYIKMLRDADKIDIMRLFIEYYATCKTNPNPILELNLPQEGDYSEEILNEIKQGKSADNYHAKNVNDLRLCKLSWVYDLNFGKSKQLFLQRQYIEKTLQVIPQTKEVLEISRQLKEFLQTSLDSASR